MSLKARPRLAGWWQVVQRRWCPQRDPSHHGATTEFTIDLLVVAA